MMRDKGPIHNIGFGVSSNEMPSREGETETPSPNSGRIAKALDNHPMMRFLGAAATALVATTVASKLVRGGGLRLGRALQESAETAVNTGRNTWSTRAVRGITELRQAFDELEGVSRAVKGVDDPYSAIVHQLPDGKLTTGYDPRLSRRKFYRPLSAQGRATGPTGITSESAELWSLRDDIQVRMVSLARRLPYELPALYATQKVVTEPLFGQNEGKRQIKWYNPADVITDFVKQSTINVATMMLPFEALGAGGAAGRSSLSTFASSMEDLRALSPLQRKAANAAIDLRSLMAEVGHDLSDVTNRALRLSSRTSGAFAAGVQEAGKAQPEFVQALRAARHGAQVAMENARNRGDITGGSLSKKLKVLTSGAKGFFTGTTDDGIGILDTIPSFKGFRSGSVVAKNQFKALGVAHDVVSGRLSEAGALDQLVQKFGFSTKDALTEALENNSRNLKLRGLDSTSAENLLEKSINKIQSQHGSKLTRLAKDYSLLGAGGPGSRDFKSSYFYRGQLEDEYKKQLSRYFVQSKQIDEGLANRFVDNLNISQLPSQTKQSNILNRITFGRKSNYAAGDSPKEFFDTILEKFRQVKGGKDFKQALENIDELGAGNALKDAIEHVDSLFLSEDFRNQIHQRIAANWNQVRSSYLPQAASQVLKPTKQSYLDFLGDASTLSEGKQSFLIRKTAHTLGIKLTDDTGKLLANTNIATELGRQGIDPTDFGYMRDFLLHHKKLSTGFFGGTNLLGLKPVLVDEALERGVFKYLPSRQVGAIREIASAQATFDPITGGLGSATETMGRNIIGGMYKTRTGEILDFTQVTNMLTRAKDFIANDFRIPVVGFNPADMLGNKSFTDIRKSPTLQYVSARSVQPFIPESQRQAEFFILNRTRGTKGVLTAFSGDRFGKLNIRDLSGLYRPIPSASTEILSREARNATGLAGERVDQIGGQTTKFAKFKQLFDVDPEQPNSLFRLFSRFKNRNVDIRNNRILSQLLSSEDQSVSYKTSRGRGSLKLDKNTLNVVDEAGVTRYSQSQVLQAVEGFRKGTYNYNIHPKVMQKLEETAPHLFTSAGVRSSQLTGIGDITNAYGSLAAVERAEMAQISRRGLDPRQLKASFSRIGKILNQGDVDIDKAGNEIFRYIAQKNQMLRSARPSIGSTAINPLDDIFTQISKTVRQLQSSGQIGLDAAIQARAYGVSTLFNFSAFTTYAGEAGPTQNAASMVRKVIESASQNPEARSMFNVFSSGQIPMVNSTMRRPFSRAIPPFSKLFGTAPYELNDMSVNLLGSGQQYTMLPTFGTAFARDPIGALKSAVGIGTYKNTEAFSTGSVPVSHMFGRLNKYFGTFGLQLDQSKYGGPLDLYLRGMVVKRVLPLFAGGATFMAADRTLGGMVNERDQRGERVYSPYFTTKAARGAVEVQSIASALMPGGPSYSEKKDELLNGEVAIRQGRYWPLGTTPFKGGKVLYYRPSYYRKLAEGSAYTTDSWSSPLEKLAFGYDFSPLRPLDPYRFERKHYYDRPYPVTGEYFTGPFGPATSLANMTIGKVLKPRIGMHEKEVAAGLANYVPAGESGAYDPSGLLASGKVNPVMSNTPNNGSFIAALQSSGGFGTAGFGGGGTIGFSNARLAAAAGPLGSASQSVSRQIGSLNSYMINNAAYGPPKVSGIMPPAIVGAGAPIPASASSFQASETGYRLQETAGIYGFAFGSLRKSFGFGTQDMSPQVSVLQAASKGYGTGRSFWDLNLGGLGDVPLAGEGAMGNIEISEITRRFIPKERSDVNYINPIPNLMGQQYPFLPGPEYFTNFKTRRSICKGF